KLKNVVNTGQREGKLVWDNTKRVNHHNFSKYLHLSKTFVPSGVLTRRGLHRPSVSTGSPSISTVRPVCTARPSINIARPVCTARPSINTARPVCTARTSINTARPVSTVRHVYVTRPIYPRMDNGNPEILLQDHAVVDSGCSSHMTGNKAYLSDYEDYNGGFVAFGSDPKGGKITVKQQPDGIFISQDKSMIGSLMYLTALRPDIMFDVCACARFQVTLKASHLNAVKRIFRYLKHQPKLGLWYPGDSPFELEAFSDSDYRGASLDRKSTTGRCQFLGRRLISWQCKKQTIVANSTTKAKYVAAANCCGQVL
ncbi:hypothetical protein Tco_1535894, partial [Tanacetum coccineum]